MDSKQRECHKQRQTLAYTSADEYCRRRMYLSRLHYWGIRKYSSAETKDILCEQLLDDHEMGRDISYMTPNHVKNLLRHCRARAGGSDPKLITLLRSMDSSLPSSASNESADLGATMFPFLPVSDVKFDLPLFDRTNEIDDYVFVDQEHGYPSSADCFEPCPVTAFDAREPSMRTRFHETNRAATASEASTPSSTSMATPASELVVLSESLPEDIDTQPTELKEMLTAALRLPKHSLSFNGTPAALEQFLHLSSAYHKSRLNYYLLSKPSKPQNTLLAISQSKSFWTDVKSAIYYLKMQNDLAWPLLQNAGVQVAVLCKARPLTLLRELFTTLSVINTSICPGLRGEMLRLFARSTYDPDCPSEPLHAICCRLQEEWVSDEVLETALRAVSRAAVEMLGTDQQEVFELKRALVRLLRRRKKFANAEPMVRTAVRDMEQRCGRDDVKTRLAMSELVYILNDQKRYEEAVAMAEDVLYRGQRDEGQAFPSERSVYAMEDLAEVYERLNRKQDAVLWLRRALKGALERWGNKAAAIHINDKLEAILDDGR